MSLITEKTSLISYGSVQYKWWDEFINQRCCSAEGATLLLCTAMVPGGLTALSTTFTSICHSMPAGSAPLGFSAGGIATSLLFAVFFCYQRFRFNCGASSPDIGNNNINKFKTEKCVFDTCIAMCVLFAFVNTVNLIASYSLCQRDN